MSILFLDKIINKYNDLDFSEKLHLPLMKSKKTGHASVLDQFYTSPIIAQECINRLNRAVPAARRKYFLEPSAGTGSFSSQLENCVSVDLDPKFPGVIRSDFLILRKEDLFSSDKSQNEICVIGNPPFGKNSSLAVKFFNHASKIGNTIAFIVPKTFRKQSLHNKINLNFWNILDIDIPRNSFIYEDQAYDVPCCFQIWVRRKETRPVIKYQESSYLRFVKKSEADFAVRRVGGTTGKAHLDFKECAEVSHYFLKVIDSKMKKTELVRIINQLDFSNEANSTAGVRSISKMEFMAKLNQALGKD